VIKRAICETRAPALQHPPVILGSYVQTDDSINWDSSTNTVISINGVPVDDDKLYSVATSNVLASGALRENPPISEYCNTLPPGTVPPLDACKGAKNIIVSHLSKSLLFGCIETIGLSNITKDDEEITKEELLQAVQKYEEKSGKASVFSDPAVLEIIVNNLFAVADLDGSGKVSKKELVALRLSMVGNMAWDNISTEHPSSIRVEDAATMVSKSLNIPVNDPAIVELMKQLDSNASGEVSIAELREYIQKEMSMEKEVLI
jgi:Ca2+-binding EF-hand superfamily protein